LAIQGRIGGRIGTRADRELVLNMTHALVIPCSGHALPAVTPRIKGCYNAGRRTDFRDKKSSDFSGEIFRERNFGRSITAPTTLFPLIGCGVDSFSPN